MGLSTRGGIRDSSPFFSLAPESWTSSVVAAQSCSYPSLGDPYSPGGASGRNSRIYAETRSHYSGVATAGAPWYPSHTSTFRWTRRSYWTSPGCSSEGCPLTPSPTTDSHPTRRESLERRSSRNHCTRTRPPPHGRRNRTLSRICGETRSGLPMNRTTLSDRGQDQDLSLGHRSTFNELEKFSQRGKPSSPTLVIQKSDVYDKDRVSSVNHL